MFNGENFVFLKDRVCILIGELKECERFYCSFQNELNIKHIIIDKETNIRLNASSGLYVKYSEIEASLGDYYCIICQRIYLGNSMWDDIFYRKGLYYKDDYIDSQYFLMHIRKKRETAYHDKEIWVFGAGDNGEQFWKTYRKEYNICGFVSNYEEEKEKCGLPVVRLEELNNRKNVFIVISSLYEISIYFQLLQAGMKAEQEFTFSGFFPKKLFVGVGTCQIYYCVSMLLGNRNFTNRFVCMTFGENSVDYASMAYRLRLRLYLEFCDVLFYQTADSQAKVSLDYTMLFKKCRNALKIKMPFYYFQGIHLQMNVTWRGKKQFTLLELEGIFSNAIVYRYKLDQEIRKLLEVGMQDKQIYSKIYRDDYFSREEVLRRFHSSIKVVKFLDKFSDIKIGPFILEQYKKIPVFTDTEHMSPELQIFIANEMAKKMGIDVIDEKSACKLIEDFRNWWPYNLYIYPSVAKALELEYWHDDMKYDNTPYANAQKMSTEEYIMTQIEFIERINRFWYWLREKNETDSK